jgi:hypothetical protein
MDLPNQIIVCLLIICITNFFEEYGFKIFFEQYTYSMPVDAKLPQTYADKADRIAKNPSYTFEHIEKIS